MGDDWDDLAGWWEAEVASDPAYPADVHPLFDELLPPVRGRTIDLGCGEGQGMRLVRGSVFGVDRSRALARRALQAGPVVVGALPSLAWCRDDAFDLAYAIYLLDLVEDHERFLAETARVVADGGHLITIINHPIYTAPGASPMLDDDGEVLFRWGRYFEPGSSFEPAGHRTIEFFHRSLGDLLTSAARAGWALEHMIERGLSETTVDEMPGYAGQQGIPRLLGLRWRRRR